MLVFPPVSAVNHAQGPRLFLSAPLSAGAALTLQKDQTRYLGAVLRVRDGATVRVFNGRDGEWRSVLADGQRRLDVAERLRPQAAEADFWLLFAPLRRDATELVVQKATELGASALLPVPTTRAQPVRLNVERLAVIAREAAEQCERLTLPLIAPPRALAEILSGWEGSRRLFVAVERRALPAPSRVAGSAAALLVGPEGGFAPAELELLGQHDFVAPVSLGPLILRAETAAIAGMALLQIPRAP